MKKQVVVKIKRPAKKSGGDRYESASGFTIYIPQDISRFNGTPYRRITITFEADD